MSSFFFFFFKECMIQYNVRQLGCCYVSKFCIAKTISFIIYFLSHKVNFYLIQFDFISEFFFILLSCFYKRKFHNKR